ncbi:MAG: hypothetical protein BWY78_01304 [Alphaproteobacteria bacterium ADurb.Bin438]|nr:MAG: hypothetical protein BWY78_01304 [Alphaproteobacteria bacterium ADurb.Bin438]
MAVAFGIKIYAVGFIGSSNADVDEPTLIRLANGTRGQYYRATNEAQLEAIYSEIDMLEPSYTKNKAYVYVDIFYIPLLISLLLLIAGMGVYVIKK